MDKTSYEQVADALKPLGLIPRGGLHPSEKDALAAATLVLIGNAGPNLWRQFPGQDGALDKWCRTMLMPLADELGAAILFPFDGPPYEPFIQWAQRAEGLSPSPIGPLIHPIYGLWHAYRGALLFPHEMNLPPPYDAAPCDTCADKPCLATCPVSAFSAAGYDVPTCAGHLKQPQGADCRDQGCRARRACPIGQDYLYQPAQAKFHMAAFLRNY